MRFALAAWRIAMAVFMALDGLWRVLVVMPRLDAAGRRACVQAWSAALLRRLGIELRVRGRPHGQGALVVSNHVSWLDICALHAVAPQVRFVSKSAIARWPLIGPLARGARTLFIEREKKRDAVRVVHEIAAALREGDTVGVFPEGTTGPGPEPLPFHANLLQAAIATGAPVQPVALRYEEPGMAFSIAARYVDGVTLPASLLRIACARGLVVHVDVLAVEPPGQTQRRQLAQVMQERIAASLRAGGRP